MTAPRPRPRSWLCGAVLAVALTACTAGGQPEGVAEELASDGVLVVGTNLTFEPFEFVEDGEPAGFDIDLVTEIAARLDLQPRFEDVPFDQLLDRVADGSVDAAASAIAITQRREAVVAFTRPYFVVNQAVVVADGGPESLEDLRGEQVAVEVGTTSLDVATDELPQQAQIVEFPTSEAAFAAVEAQQVAAVVVDAPTAAARAEASGNRLRILEQLPTREQYGIALDPDDAQLQAAVDGALAEVLDDGTYAEIYGRWFAGPVPTGLSGQE